MPNHYDLDIYCNQCGAYICSYAAADEQNLLAADRVCARHEKKIDTADQAIELTPVKTRRNYFGF